MYGLPLRAAKTAMIATAASRMIEMMSMATKLVDHGDTFHSIGGSGKAHRPCTRVVLAARTIASILSTTARGGKLQNVEIGLGARPDNVDVRTGPCGRHGLRTPPVLSAAVLSPARAARDRGRTAALERQFHHQWCAVYGTISVLLRMGRRRADQASGRRLERPLRRRGFLQFLSPQHLRDVVRQWFVVVSKLNRCGTPD
jgi:hypothetical protein